MNNLCKVLIIDDEIIMRQGIKYMLDWEQEGFEIVGQASNGVDAIELIKTQTPNIVICDIQMPQMNGIQLSEYIHSNYPDIQIIILSSYSNFEYVKSSFQNGVADYILKPSLKIEDLLNSLKKAANKISKSSFSINKTSHIDTMIKRLIMGFNSKIDYNLIAKLNPNKNFCIYGVNLKKLYPSYDERIEIVNFITNEINETLQANYKNINFSPISIENEIMICIINFNDENESKLKCELSKFADLICTKYNKCFFVLSISFNSIENIKHVYDKDFLHLSNEYFFNKAKNFICSNDYKFSTNDKPFNFTKFSNFISSMQLKEGFDLLTEYINSAIANMTISEFDLKTLIQNAFFNVISNFENLNFENLDLTSFKYKCFNDINDSLYLDDLLSIYHDLINKSLEISSIYENQINSHMIDKIIKYINDNYNKPLTLSFVSKLFNFNYYYLSSYFSSHNDEGFNEFLNKIRIEKACTFLKQDIPISEISTLVGYSDQSYFCKVFKKFTGITPTKFRKNSTN